MSISRRGLAGEQQPNSAKTSTAVSANVAKLPDLLRKWLDCKMNNRIDEWIEGLLTELKAFSILPREPGKPAHPAVPAIIADTITRHTEKIDPKLRRDLLL